MHPRTENKMGQGLRIPSWSPFIQMKIVYCKTRWACVARVFVQRMQVAMLTVLTAFLIVPTAFAQSTAPLRIEEAVAIAADGEPGAEAIRARAEALREESVVAGQLPDPQLRLGVGNFPIESGGFTTEGMTQAQIGIRQAFPAGDTRALSTRRLEAMASKMSESAAARDRDVVTAVRRSWLDLYYWERAETVVTETREYFDDLVTVTRSLYAVGKKDQQDVLQAELALSRLNDRLISINRQRARGRAALGEWIGAAARRPLDSTLPSWPALPPYEPLREALAQHPAIEAADAEVRASKAGIDLAQEQYKPGWAIDLGYGYRDGSLVTGEPRSDFVSLSVVVDLRLFKANRQDRKLSAALSERRAVEQEREQLMRRLQSQLEAEYARWQDLTRRIELYQRSILPQAEDRANAALLAYQSQSGDFTDVMRGYIDALETKLAYEQLLTERAQTHAVIANLGGLNP